MWNTNKLGSDIWDIDSLWLTQDNSSTWDGLVQSVNNRKQLVSWILDWTQILSQRHKVVNSTTQYLDELEEEYKDDEYELRKVKAITVLEDWHICIGWFSFKQWINDAEENIKQWIERLWQHTVFTQKAARNYAKNINWYKLPTNKELAAVIDATPWKTNWKQSLIMSQLLKIPDVGCIFWDEPNRSFKTTTGIYLWTASKWSIMFGTMWVCSISSQEFAPKVFYTDKISKFPFILRKETQEDILEDTIEANTFAP